MREFGDLEMAIMEVLRSGGDQDVTMRRFLERVNDDEIRELVGRARHRPIATAGRARGVPSGRIHTWARNRPDQDTNSHLTGSPQVQAPAPLASSGVRHIAFLLPGSRMPRSHMAAPLDDQ